MLNINTFLCSIGKKCHNTRRQLLVSDVVWEFGEISVFSHHASVFRIGKNPIPPVLFDQSVTLSGLSVLIGRSTLPFLATGDVLTSWLATPSVGSSWDGPVYCAATFPATVWTQIKLDWRERDNKRNKMQVSADGCSWAASQRVSCYS